MIFYPRLNNTQCTFWFMKCLIVQFAGHLSQSASKVEADTSIPKYQGHGAGPKMNGEHLQMRLALEEAHTHARPLPGRTGRGRWKQTGGRKTETWRVKPRNTRLHGAEGLSGGGNFNLAAEDANRHLPINRDVPHETDWASAGDLSTASYLWTGCRRLERNQRRSSRWDLSAPLDRRDNERSEGVKREVHLKTNKLKQVGASQRGIYWSSTVPLPCQDRESIYSLTLLGFGGSNKLTGSQDWKRRGSFRHAIKCTEEEKRKKLR